MKIREKLIYFIFIAVWIAACGSGGGGGSTSPNNNGDANTLPSSPANISCIAGDRQVKISWDDSINALSYNIYYSTSPNVTVASGVLIPNVTSPYTHTSLTNGTTYYYVITAVNIYGESLSSMERAAMPTIQTPPLNQPPVADFTGPTSALNGEVVSFDASTSYDSDGSITSYSLDFGDGRPKATQNSPVFTYSYNSFNSYVISLTVTDNQGATGSITKEFTSGLVRTDPINISVSPDLYSQYETISIDETGAINILWIDDSGTILFSKSTDSGHSFTSPIIVNQRPSPYLSYGYVKSVSVSGYIHVTWTYYTTDGHADIFYSQSTDGGATFSSPIIISDVDGINSYNSKIAADGNTIVVFWDNNSSPSYSAFTLSHDYGKTFSTPMIFAVSGACADVAIRSNQIYLVSYHGTGSSLWDIFFTKWDSNMQLTSNPIKLNGDPERIWPPTMSIDDAGNIYIAWDSDQVFHGKVKLARSTDTGNSFTLPLIISNPSDDSYARRITSIGDGIIYLSWYTRYPDFSGKTFFQFSSDRGVSFSSRVTFPFIDFAQIIAIAPYRLLSVWNEYPANNPRAEIYFSEINVSP